MKNEKPSSSFLTQRTGLARRCAIALLFAASAAAAPITYVSTNVPVPILDVTTVNSTLVVPDSYLITDINVQINLTHTFDSDLTIRLIAPNALGIAELSSLNGGSGDNYTDTIFDDAAATAITAGTAPFAGTFRPEQLLSAFNGIQVNGTWTLQVVDSASGDIGTINSWSITVDGTPDTGVPEPASAGLAGLALAGLIAAARKGLF